ncbi:MAG: M24 family metallopeptidase, partial [Candidatus Promineifilaceae bacterium]
MNPVNRRWVSGFTGSDGHLLITPDMALLATDSRYWLQAAEEAPEFELFKHERAMADMARLLEFATETPIGIEANYVTCQTVNQLSEIGHVSVHLLDDPIGPLRVGKSTPEIAHIQKAAAITDSAMTAVPQLLRKGITERELAWEIEKWMRESGADGLAFDSIVAFGAHSARPHHHPGDRPLRSGDIILVDMGARFAGYCSDLTRTF